MSTTQDAPDTRTKAQQDFDDWMARWEGTPQPSPGQTDSDYYLEIAGFMLADLNKQIAELRESKATKELVQELYQQQVELAIEIGSLHRRVDQLTAGTAEPAPTIESLIAEIEAAGWDVTIFGYGSRRNYVARIDHDSGVLISHSTAHDTLIAALQEALAKARQAVQP